ncbi:MAG: beta-ketoacyl-[acyl-carrier-protein] synthase family protein, partial [Acidobacteriota bacterium]|nr:beta-ketoacyl-[acyl-carrier-protein] synthase family protein [Acidobacteriota bacterium]
MKGRRVALTGLGCLTPIGNGVPAFTEGLRTGVSGVQRITLFDPAALDVTIAAEVKGFDPESALPARELKHVARVVPLSIAAAGEALLSAGIDASSLTLDERRRVAVVFGTGGGPVEFFEKMYGHWYRGDLKKASVYSIPTGTMGTLSSEISMRYGLKGRSHVITTGCTSSADAMGYAARLVAWGDEDLVLTGGGDAVITPGIMTGFSLMQILSKSRQGAPATASRPFDAGRDGFVLGEGAWMFVLEPLERAKARGARVLAEVCGYGTTCDAYHRVRLDESGEEPARAMQEALADAAISASDIDYVQYHGTSTLLNDRIETRATKKALGDRAGGIPGSSVKSQIGHPQGASGAAGMAATILGMLGGF